MFTGYTEQNKPLAQMYYWKMFGPIVLKTFPHLSTITAQGRRRVSGNGERLEVRGDGA